jgi:hypothetical protein
VTDGRSPILTVGIPTFNRRVTLMNLIEQLLQTHIRDALKILVVNDGSSDDTDTEVQKTIGLGYNLSYVKNNFNLGYANTFLKLFDECKTRYLMVMADDDYVVESGVLEALHFLKNKDCSFCCTQWLKEGKIYRGSSRFKHLKPSDFLSSRHAPGLIYNVAKTLNARNFLIDRVAKGCIYSSVYPQTVLVLHLLLFNHSCYYLPAATAKEGMGLPSGIIDATGDSYYSLASRLQQAACFEQLLTELPQTPALSEIAFAGRLSHLSGIYDKFPVDIRARFFRRILGREFEKFLWHPVKKFRNLLFR